MDFNKNDELKFVYNSSFFGGSSFGLPTSEDDKPISDDDKPIEEPPKKDEL